MDISMLGLIKAYVEKAATEKVIEKTADIIQYGTTSYWNSLTGFAPKRGEIVVYSDYATSSEGKDIPRLKIGDGNSYLIDLPFTADITVGDIENMIDDHIKNTSIHTSATEKEMWNKKLNYSLSGETLVLNRE